MFGIFLESYEIMHIFFIVIDHMLQIIVYHINHDVKDLYYYWSTRIRTIVSRYNFILSIICRHYFEECGIWHVMPRGFDSNGQTMLAYFIVIDHTIQIIVYHLIS